MFDINRFFGGNITGSFEPALSASDMIEAMDAEGIDRAIAWHVAQKDFSIRNGNRYLLDMIRQDERLFGLYCLVPELCREADDWQDVLDLMLKERFAGVTVFPEPHRYYLDRYSFPGILLECDNRKIPLFISMAHSGLDWPAVIALLESLPQLTCVITDIGIYGQERKFRILLEHFPNVYLESSYLSLGWGVLEDLVDVYGSGRFLFGTGFPMRMSLAASFHLKNCRIPAVDKERIFSGNIRQLLKWREQ